MKTYDLALIAALGIAVAGASAMIHQNIMNRRDALTICIKQAHSEKAINACYATYDDPGLKPVKGYLAAINPINVYHNYIEPLI